MDMDFLILSSFSCERLKGTTVVSLENLWAGGRRYKNQQGAISVQLYGDNSNRGSERRRVGLKEDHTMLG